MRGQIFTAYSTTAMRLMEHHVRQGDLPDRRRAPLVVEQIDKSRYRRGKSADPATHHGVQRDRGAKRGIEEWQIRVIEAIIACQEES
jgi:hypothetical protein